MKRFWNPSAFLMGVALGWMVLLAYGCASGQMAVPGGGIDAKWTRQMDSAGNVLSEGIEYHSNKDVQIGKAAFDHSTGTLTIENASALGSPLGAQQLQYGLAGIQAWRDGGLAALSLAGTFIGRGGGQVVLGQGGVPVVTQAPDTAQQAADRAYLIQRAQNCPFLKSNPAQQAALIGEIQTAPASMLGWAKSLLDSYSPLPTTQP